MPLAPSSRLQDKDSLTAWDSFMDFQGNQSQKEGQAEKKQSTEKRNDNNATNKYTTEEDKYEKEKRMSDNAHTQNNRLGWATKGRRLLRLAVSHLPNQAGIKHRFLGVSWRILGVLLVGFYLMTFPTGFSAFPESPSDQETNKKL